MSRILAILSDFFDLSAGLSFVAAVIMLTEAFR
jgi:hypothetical protein